MGQYADLFEDDATRQRASLNLRFGVESNPDVAARDGALAKRFGLPAGVITEFRPEYEARAKTDDAMRAIEQSPKLRGWLAQDQRRADVAHDDVGVLSTIETGIAKAARYVMGATPSGGFLGTVKAFPDRAVQGIAGVKAMGADIVEPWARLVSGEDNQVARMSAYYKGLAKQAEARGDALDPPDDSVVGGGLSGGVNSMLQSSKYLPMALAGGPVGAAMALGGMVAETIGQSYLKADAKGLPLMAKLGYAVSDGVIEYATEKGPLGALVHSIKAGTPLGKAILQNAWKENKGEQIATALQDLNEWAALNPGKPFTDYLAERPEAAAKTAIGVMVGAGGNTALMHSLQRSADMISGRDRQAEYSTAQAAMMQDAMQVALQSKLRERSPDEFRAAVQAMADGTDGAPRSVFIDAEQLNQLPQEALQALPGEILAKMQTALASNDVIEIPIGDVLAIAPGTPLEQLVVEHGRMGDPMAASQFETKQAGEQAQQWLEQNRATVIQQAQDSQAMQDSSDAVRKTIYDQLQAVGRFRQAVNDGYATWAAAFYTTMAGRMGMTPEEMHAKYPLRIVGVTGAGEVMDQPGTATRAEATGKVSPITRKPVFEVFDANGNKVSTTHSADSAEHAVAMANKMLALRTNPERAPIPAVSLPDSAPEAKKASNWKTARGEKFTNLDEDDGYLYHVTSAPAAKGIRENGLAPGAGGNFAGAYSAHSKGRVFLTERSGVSFWRDRIGDMLQHGHDKQPAVTVLRIPKSKITAELKADELGSKDARAPAYYATQTLNQSATQQSIPQTETAAFKAWFGDSKVVDAQGKPLVVYHGTRGEFTVFDYRKIGSQGRAEGAGFYFTSSKGVASGYGAPMGVFLAIKQPLAYNAKGFSKPVVQKIVRRVAELEAQADGGDIADGFLSNFGDVRSEGLPAVLREAAKLIADDETAVYQLSGIVGSGVNPEYVNRATRDVTGYDGIVADGFTNEGGGDNRIYVAFFPEQIKSSSGNSGAFDPKNPNILKQSADAGGLGQELSPESSQLIGRLAAVAGNASARDHDGQAVAVKPRIDRAAGDSELIADLQIGDPTGSEENSFSSEPSLVAVLAEMRGIVLDDPKVLRVIVSAIPIDVVNDLAGSQAAAESLLGDHSMFKDGAALDTDLAIAKTVDATDPASFLLRQVALQAAEAAGVPLGPRLEAAKRSAAARASKRDGFSQNKSNAEGPRATFNPKSLELALNKNANLSSFVHETGHFFLEVMADLSSQPDAPADIAADMGTVLAWFGVADLESWRGMTLNEQRPYHERFAESIEQYIMEGKAPSVELQPLFRKFRAWVLNVYRSAKAFIDSRTGATEIQLSDEVRKVFDRMLASKEQIQQAEEVAGMMPNTEATSEAVEKLTARSMRDLAWTVRAVADSVRRLQRETVAFRREVRIEVRAEIMGQPVYRAWQFLTGRGDAVDSALPPPKNGSTGLDVTRDSLMVAVAKMGGIQRESARRDAGVHKDYFRTESGVFGKPVFRKEGGYTADDMAGMLAEALYLPVDENGKHSLHDLEEALADELGGSPRYSMWYDRSNSMGEQIGEALPENIAFGKLSTDALREFFGTADDAVWRRLSALGMTSDTVGLAPDFVADAFGFENGTSLARALAAAESPREAIERLTDQRMLEQHGELIDPAAIQAAANQAVHNEARAKSLATELKAQAEMLNQREDTGEVNAAGSKITVSAIEMAAKQFGAAIVARTPLKDLKAKARQHTAAERRASTAWQKATMAGDTAGAVKAKQDQVLNNAAAKAAMDAMGEARDIGEFFKKVIAGSNEKLVKKGRDPDVVNAARAVLAMYGVGAKGGTSAIEYMKLLETNDPLTFAALQDSLRASIDNAQPIEALTMEQLQGLHEEIQSMWHLAKRTRQMEVQGKLIDIDDAADELATRMAAIGVPLEAAGTNSALTPAETRWRWLQFAGSLLRRTEQWAEGMDGKYGGPFLRLVFGPVKDAADAYRADRVVYRKAYQALVDAVAPTLRKGLIAAPELGYTFGKGHNGIGHAELLHAVLHTGNASNKRKLLLGRQWATENADGTMDTQKWDAFIQRMHDTGVLGRAHYDFAQGVWDLLERTKPLAQKAHRDVFGRYFAEVTADAFDTPFGQYRGGYVPAQADPRIVQDAELRALIEEGKEGMAYAFPATNKGFTKGRVEYNRPLMLDLRTIGQHIDKVLLFAHMEPAVRDVNKLLSRKPVSQPLGKIDQTIYAGMLVPWLFRSARQIVETPHVGDGGISRVLSAARSRAGMALMFANVSNTLQQLTGFAGAFAKLKADGMQSTMMKSAAMMIGGGPKAMAAAVAAASPFMANRMANEIAAINGAMNDILLDPGIYERAQAWTAKHAYFMQSAMDNTMGPIIWTSAYNAALNKGAGMSQDDAVRYADGVIRQTQGSTLPEDISRIETGHPLARAVTQFIGYFNMIANTNATQVKQIAHEVGLKRGAGKALGLVTLGLMVPIWVAEAIAQAMRGGPDDPDEDGYLDDWLMAVFGFGTIKGMFAMVPFVGQLANAGINRFNGNPADDKMSISPAVSLIEAGVGVPFDIYKAITDEANARTLVRDVASAVSIATGLPAVAIARPLGYLAGVQAGKIEPTGPADAARGLVTGTASPDSKVR